MEIVDTLQINSFGPALKADVQPAEESVFVLTSSQLREIIAQAVKEAIQPLQDRISSLEDRMQGKISELQNLQESEVSRICVDIATDRRRLAALENPIKVPGMTVTARAEKIEKYLLSRLDHKATFETLKGHLGIDNVLLNQAIKTLMDRSSGRYAITRTSGDKRKRTLVKLPK